MVVSFQTIDFTWKCILIKFYNPICPHLGKDNFAMTDLKNNYIFYLDRLFLLSLVKYNMECDFWIWKILDMTSGVSGLRLVQRHPTWSLEINNEVKSQALRFFISVYAWIIVCYNQLANPNHLKSLL